MKPIKDPSPTVEPSFYWYDIETTGTNSRLDRIVQFASQRTDLDLRPIGSPFKCFVKIPPEVLIHPEAAMITGISPMDIDRDGVAEWRLFREIQSHLGRPKTCLVGYNNTSFDDEFLRFGMYRNLLPPYDHEWRNQNCRMDLINIVRLAGALRPEGIRWPTKDGIPSFKLEEIAKINNLDTETAHDALTDVHLSLEIARLIKQKQPRLWDFAVSLRNKSELNRYFDPLSRTPLLHVSVNYSNERYCVAPILLIAEHPRIKSQVIAVDLMSDVSQLIERTAGELRESLFSPASDITREESAVSRPGIYTFAKNKSPIIAPLATLRDEDATRIGIDRSVVESAAQTLTQTQSLPKKLSDVYDTEPKYEKPQIAEEALYDGFIPDEDSAKCRRVWKALDLGKTIPELAFTDSRLNELASRFKINVAWELTSEQERVTYRKFVRDQLTGGNKIQAMQTKVEELLAQPQSVQNKNILATLNSHMARLASEYGL